AARGYRTLVVTHGPAGVLRAARVALGIGFAGGTLLAVAGWLPRLCLVFAPIGLWVDHWLDLWASLPGGGSERWARGLAWRLFVGAALTIALAWVDYLL